MAWTHMINEQCLTAIYNNYNPYMGCRVLTDLRYMNNPEIPEQHPYKIDRGEGDEELGVVLNKTLWRFEITN